MLEEQGDGPHPNFKKSTQSGEHHRKATSAQHRIIPDRYNPSEEVANISKIDKCYFIKIETSVNRVNSNAIVSAMERRARHLSI